MKRKALVVLALLLVVVLVTGCQSQPPPAPTPIEPTPTPKPDYGLAIAILFDKLTQIAALKGPFAREAEAMLIDYSFWEVTAYVGGTYIVSSRRARHYRWEVYAKEGVVNPLR